ncbi:MAG: SulP family inorganic anion transporter, partial [Chloroflexi bacterium]|nr:SulP family inorganic anion transporter [Chloroflexota bacterium]
MRGYQRGWLRGDVVAGITLAAVAIPECMGYARIAGMPVVTGLYTLLLPLAAFALLGSSWHLVVGADSATAAILYGGLIGLAQPLSPDWLELASATALLTAGLLLVARILQLGFLANFLSRTVLVGFLSGVGITLLVKELPDMLGVPTPGGGVVAELLDTVREVASTQPAAVALAVGVLLVIVVTERVAPGMPAALLAVGLAIVVTWALGLERYGVQVVGTVPSGLPSFHLPNPPPGGAPRLLSTGAAILLVVVAQSAATSRSFAQKYDEPVDENRDLVGICLANALAGLSSSFVVNGSPTKTAVVDAAGSRTQLAQLVTVGVTLAVLLVLTPLIAHLPNAALAALVFLIGLKLIDLRSLRQLWRQTRGAFAVTIGTLLAVVLLGVELGILLAIGFSILDHLRREYRPRDVVLVASDGHLRAEMADPGIETRPGLIIYRFGATLFFANVDYFS